MQRQAQKVARLRQQRDLWRTRAYQLKEMCKELQHQLHTVQTLQTTSADPFLVRPAGPHHLFQVPVYLISPRTTCVHKEHASPTECMHAQSCVTPSRCLPTYTSQATRSCLSNRIRTHLL